MEPEGIPRRNCATGVQAARQRPGEVGRTRISNAIRPAPIMDAARLPSARQAVAATDNAGAGAPTAGAGCALLSPIRDG
jgi:hypothetical protein